MIKQEVARHWANVSHRISQICEPVRRQLMDTKADPSKLKIYRSFYRDMLRVMKEEFVRQKD